MAAAENKILTPSLMSWLHSRLNAIGPDVGLAVTAVQINDDGADLVEFTNFGIAKEDGERVNKDTIMPIASCSKAFNAAAVGLIIDDGIQLPDGTVLSWGTKVRDCLPEEEWVLQDKEAQTEAELLDLCSHRLGIPAHNNALSAHDTPTDVCRKLRYLRPTAKVGEKGQYFNFGIITSSIIVERLSSHPVAYHVQKRIFEPLGMTSSTYFPSDAAKTGRLSHAFGTMGETGEKRVMRRVPFWSEGGGGGEVANKTQEGPGGVNSTARDMAQWLRCLLRRGRDPKDKERKILTPAAFDECINVEGHERKPAERTDPDGTVQKYGLGWFVSEWEGHKVVSHTGGQMGVSTLVAFMPDDKLGMVFMSNVEDGPMHPLLAEAQKRIMSHVLQPSSSLPEEPVDKKDEPSTPEVSVPRSTLESLTGTYEHGAYGTISLQRSEGPDDSPGSAAAHFSALGLSKPSALYALLPGRFWVSHLRLLPLDAEGQAWSVEHWTIWPNGFGNNMTPMGEKRNRGLGEFVLEDGKVLGMAWNPASGDEVIAFPGESVRDRAEVWWTRVLE